VEERAFGNYSLRLQACIDEKASDTLLLQACIDEKASDISYSLSSTSAWRRGSG